MTPPSCWFVPSIFPGFTSGSISRLTYRGFERLKRAFDLFDGQEIGLFRRERGGKIVYHVAVWPKENMDIMDAVYEAEQTHPDRRYTDDKQKFMLDWLQKPASVSRIPDM